MPQKNNLISQPFWPSIEVRTFVPRKRLSERRKATLFAPKVKIKELVKRAGKGREAKLSGESTVADLILRVESSSLKPIDLVGKRQKMRSIPIEA